MSQAEVAAAAGTSQPTLAAYESGKKAPSVSTLERLAASMGATLVVDIVFPEDAERVERPVHLLSREERRSVWLPRAVAVGIQHDPERARALARASLRTMARADDGRGERWRRAWAELLAGPLDEVLANLCSTSTYAAQLRQTTPFAGVLDPHERWAVYESFANAEREAQPA